jgi:hypothetical protein
LDLLLYLVIDEEKESQEEEVEECVGDRIARKSDERLEDEEEDDLDGNEIEEELMEPTSIDEDDDDAGREEEEEQEGLSPHTLNPEAKDKMERQQLQGGIKLIADPNEEEEGGKKKQGLHDHDTNDLIGREDDETLVSIPLDMRKKRAAKKVSLKKSNHSTRIPLQNSGRKLASSSKGTAGSKSCKATSKGGSNKELTTTSSGGYLNSGEEESPEDRLKTREKLLAALTALNGQQSSRVPRTQTIKASSAQRHHQLNSCSASRDQIKVEVPEEEDDDDDEEENDSMIFSKGDVSGSFDAERLKAFNVI